MKFGKAEPSTFIDMMSLKAKDNKVMFLKDYSSKLDLISTKSTQLS